MDELLDLLLEVLDLLEAMIPAGEIELVNCLHELKHEVISYGVAA